jgi:hypothetical protein
MYKNIKIAERHSNRSMGTILFATLSLSAGIITRMARMMQTILRKGNIRIKACQKRLGEYTFGNGRGSERMISVLLYYRSIDCCHYTQPFIVKTSLRNMSLLFLWGNYENSPPVSLFMLRSTTHPQPPRGCGCNMFDFHLW